MSKATLFQPMIQQAANKLHNFFFVDDHWHWEKRKGTASPTITEWFDQSMRNPDLVPNRFVLQTVEMPNQ